MSNYSTANSNDDVGPTLLSGIDRSPVSNTSTNHPTSHLSSTANNRCSKMLSRLF